MRLAAMKLLFFMQPAFLVLVDSSLGVGDF
jgi:hypothetical protein